MPVSLLISCLCGAVTQTVTVRPAAVRPASKPPTTLVPLTLCHCNTCRHTSGVLCTSYCPIQPVDTKPLLASVLTMYVPSPATARYFCRTCGCHVFRSRRASAEDDATSVDVSNCTWEVATGVISAEVHSVGDDHNPLVLAYTGHDKVADTGDGGLAVWLPEVAGRPLLAEGTVHCPTAFKDSTTTAPPKGDNGSLAAACHCGTVRFTVMPPEHNLTASQAPRSGFADLIYPFATTDPSIVANPHNVKWWLRPAVQNAEHSLSATQPIRYLAGTCACRTCRLSSGFEIQTWAFVPRANILLPDGQCLDFTSAQPFATYKSSPGIERNFCPSCGANLFWHDVWRPELIDVSVGLLRADKASRAESLLDWWTGRVSFAEESRHGRSGLTADRAAALIDGLQAGMQKRTAAGTI